MYVLRTFQPWHFLQLLMEFATFIEIFPREKCITSRPNRDITTMKDQRDSHRNVTNYSKDRTLYFVCIFVITNKIVHFSTVRVDAYLVALRSRPLVSRSPDRYFASIFS